ncbi:hypothetical protein ACP4OV_011627 [Aristida adscensionis]
MQQLLGSVEKIHATGEIHRDIKPDNVLVGPGAILKICDFGAATLVIMSTRYYGPPIDLWALGCVMAELLTGAPLFGHVETELDMIVEVIHPADDIGKHGPKVLKGLPELS